LDRINDSKALVMSITQAQRQPGIAAAFRVPHIPAGFFGIVLGLGGLGNCWRAAATTWHMPAQIGEAIHALAVIVWAVLVVLFALKWLFARAEAVAEAFHPVQCCFVGLAGVSTMLIAVTVQPYSRAAAVVLFALGAIFTLGFALWRTGFMWQGGRDPAANTPALYLPMVAGGYVAAITASALGWPDWGQLAFGAALFSWLAIESVVLHRFYMMPAMPPPLRPTLSIQLAPPTVGTVAYLAVNGGVPDLLAHALIGYGLLQALLMLRMVPWVLAQPFHPSYWGYTFGATALANAPLRMVAHGDAGAMAILAPVLFIGANLVVGIFALATIWLILRGRLLPPVAAAAPPAPPAIA
jgi:tellurite resistance protein